MRVPTRPDTTPNSPPRHYAPLMRRLSKRPPLPSENRCARMPAVSRETVNHTLHDCRGRFGLRGLRPKVDPLGHTSEDQATQAEAMKREHLWEQPCRYASQLGGGAGGRAPTTRGVRRDGEGGNTHGGAGHSCHPVGSPRWPRSKLPVARD